MIRVDVYRNLNNAHPERWSIRAAEGPQRGRVILYRDTVLIADAYFVVQPSGRKRAREEGRKNVHAFVRGHLAQEIALPLSSMATHPIRYDPFGDCPSFEAQIRREWEPIHWGRAVLMPAHGPPLVRAAGVSGHPQH